MVQMIVVFGEIVFLMNEDSNEGLAVCFWVVCVEKPLVIK